MDDFATGEKVVQDAAVDLAEACARVSDIAAAPPIVTHAEVQVLAEEEDGRHSTHDSSPNL